MLTRPLVSFRHANRSLHPLDVFLDLPRARATDLRLGSRVLPTP